MCQVFIEEKLDGTGTRLEQSLENPSDTFQNGTATHEYELFMECQECAASEHFK
jgi:hypothetical protein